ncbi:hypothetical protein [Streptomyces mobaraensis]|uniref:Lipoprotein n=1 Tax=Streptomyces mobaraensis TaxID=35621 RepID=A0A5N5W6I6_STRMB|nr:hypothetical protein [Streptomyces mobaraensis]KAB7843676.1 hypothetical protein FRZ00_17090 [Streptomyces mobaraensis]
MRPSHRGALPTTLAALILSVLAGCSGTHHGSAVAPAAPAAAPGSPDRRPADDPATWTLPLMRYLPTDAQARTIGRARETLTRDCARRYGITLTPEPELPPLGPKNVMDWRYGIHDRGLTARRGYQVDDAQQARYDAALRARGKLPRPSPDTSVVVSGTRLPPDVLAAAGPEARKGVVAGKPVPDGGCAGEAQRTLGTATQGVSPFVARLMTASYPRSMEEPDVRRVFARWSGCMRERGFRYAAPMDANDDPAFRPGPRGVTREEIATAVADLDCRAAHRVAEVWHTAETRLQNDVVAREAATLAAERRALDRTLATARRVVEGKS